MFGKRTFDMAGLSSELGPVRPAASHADVVAHLRDMRLSALAACDLWDLPFVVVDVETTGSVAGRDAITEIALVSLQSGRITDTWRTLVNPLVPIPEFITRLTGITDDMVANAPVIADLVPAIAARIKDAVVVGHNVRFDVQFINQALVRHGWAPLSNVLIDTLTLARHTIIEVPNYKLGTLTRELGIDVERHHRAHADAVATASLLWHCLRRLEDEGVYTLGQLVRYLRETPSPQARPRPRLIADAAQLPVWTSVLQSELRAVPAAPGAYTLQDASDRVLYVGKSRNLRQRLRAYVSGKPAGVKIRALRAALASFSYSVTGSEFEALLLEAELVGRHDPPFNERLRHVGRFGFIKIRPGPDGTVQTTTRLVPDGSRYYGPYRNLRAARAAVVALREVSGLEWEPDAETGPQDKAEDRSRMLERVLQFMEGEDEDVLLWLARRRDEAAARAERSRTQRLAEMIERLRGLRDRHARLLEATSLNLAIFAPAVQASHEVCFVVCRGRVVARVALPRRLPERPRAQGMLAGALVAHYRPGSLPRCFARQDEIDHIAIVAGWCTARREGLIYAPLPDRAPEPEESGVWAMRLLDGEPVEENVPAPAALAGS